MKKLPLVIGQEMVIKSLLDSKSPHRAKSSLIGAKHGEFIIVDEPIIRISDHIVSIVEGPVHCWFLKDGTKYSFESTILKKLDDGLTFLEYPKYFNVEHLRKHERVKVNLETRFTIEDRKEFHKGSILDISQGGCMLKTDGVVIIPEQSRLTLSFVLPNDRVVNNIEGVARHVTYNRMKQATEVGIQFTGPKSEVTKIAEFCYMCQFFKVE